MARGNVHLNISAPSIYDIRMGQEKPNPTLGDNLDKWQRNNANIYSVPFLATNGGATTVVRRHEGQKPDDGEETDRKLGKRLRENTTLPVTPLVRSCTTN